MLTAGEAWVAAVAVAIVRGSRVLALRRAKARDAGVGIWEVVSGRIEAGESLVEAALREVREETGGLEVELEERPIDAYVASRGSAPMLVVVFRARHLSGEAVPSDEHDAHGWLSADELVARHSPARLVEAVRRALAG